MSGQNPAGVVKDESRFCGHSGESNLNSAGIKGSFAARTVTRSGRASRSQGKLNVKDGFQQDKSSRDLPKQ